MSENQLYAEAAKAYRYRKRLVAPLLGFPGVRLTGTTIKLAQQNAEEHIRVLEELAGEFAPDVMFPLMDLTVEANALGAYTDFPVNESATVPKQEFDFHAMDRLSSIDLRRDGRVWSYAETVRLMNERLPDDIIRGAYVSGPYTVAGQLVGADEAAMYSITHQEELTDLCRLCNDAILDYVEVLIGSGAQLICVLEPSAMMLGPGQFESFSGAFLEEIFHRCNRSDVQSVLHICGDTMHLLNGMIDTGVDGLSLDSPDTGMEFTEVLSTVPENMVIIGNVNPATTMLNGSPDEVNQTVTQLLESMEPFPNFVLSTGCDLPLETPLENIHEFMETGRGYAIPDAIPGE